MSLSIMTKETEMNATLAIDAYSRNKSETISQEHLGHGIISAALNQLKTNLRILFSSNERKNRIKAFDQALLTIYFLQKGLDLSRSGDLEKSLFRLYEFCRLKVVENDVDNCRGSAEIKNCLNFISEINDSWTVIKNV